MMIVKISNILLQAFSHKTNRPNVWKKNPFREIKSSKRVVLRNLPFRLCYVQKLESISYNFIDIISS